MISNAFISNAIMRNENTAALGYKLKAAVSLLYKPDIKSQRSLHGKLCSCHNLNALETRKRVYKLFVCRRVDFVMISEFLRSKRRLDL